MAAAAALTADKQLLADLHNFVDSTHTLLVSEVKTAFDTCMAPYSRRGPTSVSADDELDVLRAAVNYAYHRYHPLHADVNQQWDRLRRSYDGFLPPQPLAVLPAGCGGNGEAWVNVPMVDYVWLTTMDAATAEARLLLVVWAAEVKRETRRKLEGVLERRLAEVSGGGGA